MNRRCERRDCLPCQSRENDSGGIGCQKENVTYTITCRECARSGKKAVYWGETSKTGYKRGTEHVDGLKREVEKAPLWRHSRVFHNGVKRIEWYRMKVEKVHRTPLVRQISEGVEISRCDADIVMNSKGEWNGSRLPRMVIERGDKVELDSDDINVRMMNWEDRRWGTNDKNSD